MWNSHEALKETLYRQYSEHNWTDGMQDEALTAHVNDILYGNARKPVARRKAEAMAFIMRNAQFDICPDEFFADKLNHLDLMRVFTSRRIRGIRETECESVHKSYKLAHEIKAFCANMDFGHIAPDWKFLFENGVPGALNRLKAHRANCETDKRAFYDCSITVYEAIIALMRRMADRAKQLNTPKTRFMAVNLRQLAVSAPQTLAQGMQLTLLYYSLQTQLDCATIRSLGGLDRLYWPLYKADLASGRFTDDQLRELTRDFLWKISAMKVTANLPFYICGAHDDGRDASNDYTRVLLEEYRKLNIYDPKLHVMYLENTRADILRLIFEMIREGKNSFVFINTNAASRALMNLGIAPEDARKVIIYGCYEAAAEGAEAPCTCGGNVNLVKAVELALNDGVDPMTGARFGPATGEDLDTFDQFMYAVKAQLSYIANSCMQIISAYEPHYKDVCPAPMMSATYRESVEKGLDVYEGGAKYNNTSLVGAGIATLTDSVLAVKRMVYDEKRLTLCELRACLQNNWAGYEALRADCLHSAPKYGNNLPEADGMAIELFEHFADSVNNMPNGRGGVFRCGMFSVDWRFWMGAACGATPDGRMSGEPLSKNTAAVIGQDRNGVTAYLNTMLKYDPARIPDGAVADVVMHQSAVSGEDGMAAFLGLLTAYMANGGFAAHFNVLNPNALINAQREPEKYKNLQIRLCGWNVNFVDLSKREQDEFILQASREA